MHLAQLKRCPNLKNYVKWIELPLVFHFVSPKPSWQYVAHQLYGLGMVALKISKFLYKHGFQLLPTLFLTVLGNRWEYSRPWQMGNPVQYVLATKCASKLLLPKFPAVVKRKLQIAQVAQVAQEVARQFLQGGVTAFAATA